MSSSYKRLFVVPQRSDEWHFGNLGVNLYICKVPYKSHLGHLTAVSFIFSHVGLTHPTLPPLLFVIFHVQKPGMPPNYFSVISIHCLKQD